MSRYLLLLVMAALSAGAQEQAQPARPAQPQAAATTQVTERAQAPSYSDLYCAGFLRKQPIAHSNYIVGGTTTPDAANFAQNEMVFIEGGGLQEGAMLSIVRELKDPNRNELYMGQHAAIRAAGQPYADIGRLRVVTVRENKAIARIEFSCATAVPGDLVIPFEERGVVAMRGTVPFDRFPAPAGGPSGRIIMARDFDGVVGTGQKVYVNLGSDQGIKAGDYLRVVRSYDPDHMDKVDSLSYKAPTTEDTQNRPVKITRAIARSLPRRAVGQMLVLMANPGSSTAMITLALEAVQVGDIVEVEAAPSAAPQ